MKVSNLSIQTAASVWQDERTSHKQFDPELAQVVAERIEGLISERAMIQSQPLLGNVTTAQLIAELRARHWRV